MKQEILSEVNRIHEIMGILNENKEIIFEASGPGPKNQIVTKFFESIGLAAEKDLDKSWQSLQKKVSSGAASQEEKDAETIIRDFLRSKPDVGALSPSRFSTAVDKYGDDLLELFYKTPELSEALLKAFEKVNPAFSKVKEKLLKPNNFDKMYKKADLEKWKASMTSSIDGMASVPNYLKPELQQQLEKNFEELAVELAEKNAQRVAKIESDILELKAYFDTLTAKEVSGLEGTMKSEFFENVKKLKTNLKEVKGIDADKLLSQINSLKSGVKELTPGQLNGLKKLAGKGWNKIAYTSTGEISYLKIGIYSLIICGVVGRLWNAPICKQFGYLIGLLLGSTIQGAEEGAKGAQSGYSTDNSGGQNQQGGGQNSNQTSNGQTEETIKTWLTADANGEHNNGKWDIKTLGGIIYDASKTPNNAIAIVANKQWPMTYSNNTWNWD